MVGISPRGVVRSVGYDIELLCLFIQHPSEVYMGFLDLCIFLVVLDIPQRILIQHLVLNLVLLLLASFLLVEYVQCVRERLCEV